MKNIVALFLTVLIKAINDTNTMLLMPSRNHVTIETLYHRSSVVYSVLEDLFKNQGPNSSFSCECALLFEVRRDAQVQLKAEVDPY